MTHVWPMVRFGDVLESISRPVVVDATMSYRILGMRWYAQGLFLKEIKAGNQIRATELYEVRTGDFVYNRLFAWKGSFGVADETANGGYVSGEFPCFAVNTEVAHPKYLHLYLSQERIWTDVQRNSTGMTNVSRLRLKEQDFLNMDLPLPPLDEQHRIVARIESLAAKIEEVRGLCRLIETDLDRTLLSAYHSIADNAVRKPMIEVAPLTRRPADISVEEVYQQVSVRSFGRGTFHQPDLSGSDITWQKPYLVKAGDILISNIKAWEGAIAVASENDDGRYGSHRYLTCVPVRGAATSRFVCFHLLTRDGLYEIGEASPGSADRNRTLNAKALMQIPIPVPPIEKQMWFDNLQVRVDAMKAFQAQTQAELDALLPSVLDRAFRGEL